MGLELELELELHVTVGSVDGSQPGRLGPCYATLVPASRGTFPCSRRQKGGPPGASQRGQDPLAIAAPRIVTRWTRSQ